MANPSARGSLFAIDGIHGGDLTAAARRLLLRETESGELSVWNASGLFLKNGATLAERVSARTMLLLYAADIHFRLRSEIQPALELGKTVVAAPYVETGVAFGLAMGLSARWLDEVFRFAPKPAETFWLDGAPANDADTSAGFLEFCSKSIEQEFHQGVGDHFENLERHEKCRRFRL